MSQRKVERMKKDQRGFTIVELLIAVAILAIVVASVCGFILVGSRSYASANSDISVQQEAQLALNQMSDVLIDTTRSVNYAGYKTLNPGEKPVLALKDSEFGFEPVGKSLIMYNGAPTVKNITNPDGTTTTDTTIEPGNGNKHYQFYWDKTDETLYYAELDVEPDDVADPDDVANPMHNIRFPDFGDPGWVVLAEHVTRFEVDLTQVEEKRVVQLHLTFVNGKREYTTSNNVTIRNKVAVNDAEIGPLNRSKTISIVPKELSVILEPGETYHFSTPKVTGQNVTDKSVTWSIAPGYSGSSSFTDSANGIIQIAADEPAGSFIVIVKTNARNDKNEQAEAPVTVQIKRVTNVSLGIAGNSDNIVEAGSEFTVQANVGGNCLGVVCDGCGEPVDKDFDVVNTGAVDNWEVVEGAEYVTIEQTREKSADFKLTSAAEDGATIRIRATSYLSTRKLYDKVWGELVLHVKGGENAEPISGMLKYGEETLIKEITGKLPTTGHEYVTCVRVVDNNSPETPAKILLYFTIGHGADYRIVPDMFDLDLDGSYTFYMQALDPVSIENHKNNNHHQADSNEDIWKEYLKGISETKPYGYEGDKYEHSKVYYSVLDKPRAIWEYNGVRYKGKDITYDPVNIYTLSQDSNIIGSVEPVEYENIWHTGRTQEKMTYSVYEGEGDRSKWEKNPIYVFNGSTMRYEGSTSVGDGVGQLMIKDTPGRPSNPSSFFVLKQGDKLKVCGNYHIVTGFCYNNTYDNFNTDAYEFIGWQGFSCDGKEQFVLPHNYKYYEFDDSVIHVKVTSEFTMDINDVDIDGNKFEGQALFPLPSQMKGNALFPNMQSTDWMISGGALTVPAMREGNNYTENLRFDYVRYRYVPRQNTYEVEPIQIRKKDNKLVIHSYGTYVCEENGAKWSGPSRGGADEELIFNIKQFEYNGGQYQTYFPLPDELGFPFISGNGKQQTSYEVSLYDNNLDNKVTLSGLTVEAEESGGTWTIRFVKRTRADAGDANNHKILVESYGTYAWREGQIKKEWEKQKGYEKLPDETNLKVNLFELNRDSKSYKLYFPLPSENDFPFKGSTKKIENYKPVAYEMSDTYGEKAYKDTAYTVEYEKTGDTYQIEFVDRTRDDQNDPNNHLIHVKSYGTYTWQESKDKWEQTVGYKEYDETDLKVNLFDLERDGKFYKLYFPSPTENDFPFKDGTKKIEGYKPVAYEMSDTNGKKAYKDTAYTVEYENTGGTYKIEFVDRTPDNQYDPNNHQINVKSYGTYIWQEDTEKWKQEKAGYVDQTTDFKPNLHGLTVDGTNYKMYFPLPGEAGFPFRDGVTSIECTSAHVMYKETDQWAKDATKLEWNYNVKYTLDGNTHKITFFDRHNSSREFGTFKWQEGQPEPKWTKMP